MRLTLLPVMAITVIGAIVFCSQDRGPNLDDLLARSVGGGAAVEKLSHISTFYMAGRVLLNGMSGRFEQYVAVPDKTRFEMTFASFSIVQGFDGHLAWQQDHNGMVNELSGYEKNTLLSQVYFLTYSPLFEDRMPGGREYLGTEERNGEIFHKVAFYPLHHDTVFSFFDLQTSLQRYDVLYLDNLETVTEYLGHTVHEGVTMALTSRTTALAAQITAELTVDTIAFNAEFDQSIFLRPQPHIDYRFPEGSDTVRIPFTFLDGHIYVPAEVNGMRYVFILDSGASSNFFNRAVQDELGLPAVGSMAAIGVAGYYEIALVRTDSVVIGDLVLLAQVGGSLDFTAIGRNWIGDIPFGGLLGYDFLSRFPVLIDYESRALTIYNPDNFNLQPGGVAIPFELTMQIPTVEAKLVGLQGRFLVDLGNAFELIIHDDFREKHDLESRLTEVRDISQTVGGVGGGVRGKTGLAATFVLGDIQVTDLRVMLPDSAGGLTGSVALAGNIGNLMLQEFRVLFDYSGQRLVLYDPIRTGD